MKRGIFLAAAIATMSLIGGPAVAQDTIRAENPASITTVLFDRGMASKVDIDSYGDPMIQFRNAGRQYTIFFYNCTDGADCTNVQFYIGYETNGEIGTDLVNAMNQENRFTNATIDAEDDVVITLDILPGANGITAEDFGLLLDLFIETAADFEERVGWVTD